MRPSSPTRRQFCLGALLAAALLASTATADDYFGQGSEAYERGDLAAAAASFRAAARFAPSSEAWNNVGEVLLAVGGADARREAADAFARALELDPRNANAAAGLQEARQASAAPLDRAAQAEARRLIEGAEDAGSHQEVDAAIAGYAKAWALLGEAERREFGHWLPKKVGDMHAEKQRPLLALPWCKAAAKLAPRNVDVLLGLVDVAAQAQEYDVAMAAGKALWAELLGGSADSIPAWQDRGSFLRLSLVHTSLSLRRGGDVAAAVELFDKAVRAFPRELPYVRPDQIPMQDMIDPCPASVPLDRPQRSCLRARAFWDGGDGKPYPAEFPWVAKLEAAVGVIKAELDAFLIKQPRWTLDDSFEIVSSKSEDRWQMWTEYALMRQGDLNMTACANFPRTCKLLLEIPQVTGLVNGEYAKGEIEFLAIAPGAVLTPHTGPTNERLHAHLGLRVPEGVGLRVGGELREPGWQQDGVIVFDDSFIHDVFHKGAAEGGSRYVLHMDFFHPDSGGQPGGRAAQSWSSLNGPIPDFTAGETGERIGRRRGGPGMNRR